MKTIMFPGQGSQFKGMGKDVFDLYPAETSAASEILGYDLRKLCLEDADKKLNLTQFTQPALFMVNALKYKEKIKEYGSPDYLIGHSLGEYNALLASGVFDFETGVRLVKKRGELMAEAEGGGMAVVLGSDIQNIQHILKQEGYDDIDIANFNTPVQTVIAGPVDTIIKAVQSFEKAGIKTIQLNVSAAFHSRYMIGASEKFASFLEQFSFSSMQIPVIVNTSAEPYVQGHIAEILSRQICSPVLWTDSVAWLINKGVNRFEEIGGSFLIKMAADIQADHSIHQKWRESKQPSSLQSERKKRLFMLPFVGGNRYSYQLMMPYLKDFEVRPLELPGRGKRIKEPLLGSFFDAMGDFYRQISSEIEPDQDVIYGHSLGAILGYWITYRLEKAKKSPARLIVSGVPEPHVRRSDVFQSAHELSEKDFIQRLLNIGGIPEGFIENEELFRYNEPILRADFKVLDSLVNHDMKDKIKSPLIAVMGTEEPAASHIGNWKNYTEGKLEYYHLEGNHFFINHHPKTMADLILKSL